MAAYKFLSVTPSLNLYELPQLALATHPDKNPDNEEATRQFQQISEAYRVLATNLDKSDHSHEYAHRFNEYDDDGGDLDDYDSNNGEGGHPFFDFKFDLWVVCRPLFETRLQISRRFMFQQMLGGGRGYFRTGNRNALFLCFISIS